MEGIKQRAVDKVRGPDHGRGPNQETARKACQAIARTESGDSEQNLERPAEALPVE